MHNLVHFTQGTAFMFLLMASFYFLNKSADRLRFVLGCVLAYGLVLHIIDFSLMGINHSRPIYLDNMASVFCITAIPACAFIVYELINPNAVTVKMIALHEFPFVLLVVAYAITLNDNIYYLSLLMAVLYSLIFAVVLFISIPKYHKRLKEHFSFTENLEIKWLWSILVLFIIFLTIWIYTSFKDDVLARTFYYVGTSIIWTSICYFINKHQLALKTLRELPSEISQEEQFIAKTEFDINDIKQNDENLQQGMIVDQHNDFVKESIQQYHFAERLNSLFEKQKIYLNPKLTLNEVAYELKTNRTYLSDYLNRVLETNFFDFVNEFRLEYAAELLIKDLSLTLEQVAEQSGFNSLSTFRRSFSKRYSCTPHNYRKNPSILV